MHNLKLLGWVGTLASLILSLAPVLWLWRLESDKARYLGIFGAVAVALFFALLVVWLRGVVGAESRRHPRTEGVAPLLVILSWSATALLAVPALIAVAAALPLARAIVCSDQVNERTYTADALFVGETKDRVYIGDDQAGRIISVPTSKVSRLLIGGDAADPDACTREAN